jgi:hypothetical protein
MSGLVLLAASSMPSAKELAWRQVSHINESHPLVLADTGGYTVGSGKGSGLAFFKDGEVATVSLGFNIDYLKGDGTFIAYENYAFADGSAFSLKRFGRTRSLSNGAGAEFDGTFELLNGKGRYAGIRGKGSFTGQRVSPLGAGADQYFDFTADAQTP